LPINKDISDGIAPPTVGTFSELHDYVDANEYLIEALRDIESRWLKKTRTVTSFTGTANQVSDAVDEWLRNGRK
jgi:hypothetical protein